MFRVQSLLLGSLAAFLVCRAELSVTLTPQEESRFIYEPFTLNLNVNSEAEPEIPKPPAGGGFSVGGIYETDTGFQIELFPQEAGTLTIPPIEIRAGEETVRTAPLRLTINEPRPADEMELAIALSQTELFVDQPVLMEVVWSSSVPFTRCQNLQFDIPLLRSSAWDVYPLEPDVPEEQRIGLPVNGQRVIGRMEKRPTETIRFSFRLIPRRSAVFEPSNAGLNCALMSGRPAASRYPSYFDNHFFNRPDPGDRFEQIYLTATVNAITVQALPKQNRTPRYSGIVGDCILTTDLRPAETVVGRPMPLTLTVGNLTFGKQIQALSPAVLEGLGPLFSVVPEPMHRESSKTSATFTYVVRPLRSGTAVLPALAMQVFDPDKKEYRTVRSRPIDIAVEPDGTQTMYRPVDLNEKTKTPLSGIQSNRTEGGIMNILTQILNRTTDAAWLLWLLPPILWFILRPWFRRRDRCRTDPAYARARHAKRRFRRTVRIDEETAWRRYLADRFNLNAEAVTFESVSAELIGRDADANLIEEIRQHFEREETAVYAPPPRTAKEAPSAKQLVQRIEKTIPILLLILCLLPALAARAAAPENLFEQALAVQSEKPDEAIPLFTEAALEFEVDDQFLNAGNAWFFAGETGRALACYRAAENRNPFDRQLRESIAFIRNGRTDRFLEKELSANQVVAVWNRFSRWSPALRFGLLTLFWLTGWAVFLTARFYGKRLPRRLWIVLGLGAAVPALSLMYSAFQPSEGVVIQTAEARLGPGYAYGRAYEEPLHEATEFEWLDEQNGWVHARLPDNSDAWLRKSACSKVQ